ncbi:hypothetical protein G7046_g6156 [Stylonectria norvegica]|nr:hypothetical protein G7046_g6156 [Stylonectria norvegica]
MGASWEETASAVQRHRNATISQVVPTLPDIDFELPQNVTAVPRRLLTKAECDITELPIEKLKCQIESGKLTVLETTKAYLRRAALSQKLVNCITELLPKRAIQRASELDAYFLRHGKTVGPLHGIPISVKEHIDMKGLTVNVGFVGWAENVALDDGLLLRCLWKAGCVFYARTTEPQTLMQLETSSNLYGTTVNPFNTLLTCGGSSGGEGALGGLRGSCLGIATDIGGSIRSPAANNGLYGFKPTALRLPGGGMSAAMSGSEHIPPTAGPVSTSIDGVKLFMKAVLDQKPHLIEPNLAILPWRDGTTHLRQVDGRPSLKIGVMWSDGIVRPHPPVLRALKETTEKLAGYANITLVDWIPYNHGEAWEILSALYFADGAEDVMAAIHSSGEPLLPLSDWVINEACKRRKLSVQETWQWQKRRNNYRAAYAKRWNDTAGSTETTVDVILCPVAPGAAPPLGCAKYWGYTAVWNLLDYPALVFPVTKVDAVKDAKELGYCPQNSHDADNDKLYNPETYKDAPVGLQLIGRRFDDEKVIESFDLIKRYLSMGI